ncbi:MerR family transcriptional regulator [Lysinibacillus sp. HST-98]|uniref:MerR family transcriptional regulator n=1 Tax=Lysinibacillus TaxID=400634 RepID=UPI0001DA5571|nr:MULTISPECIES: MerR family transcriptional regulator [Lysinibacillus]EFI69634.1 HTH-type transcriptional regulator skgA [Lysinibacillus fusiformis ZC1]EKU40530.1 HTH-type transcriptional regulator skgA [Lysinibacillus fusiformis ZB2]MBL3729050.1 MerR family transcriptional regulator [Lysinibacillus sp. HST-98]MBU5250586.1 MerR family transcriptional regulator [Lysinibacillus capsici]MED4698673.1 MerR family transcriptional regulator [Lysinibacillus capsici]
MEYTIQELAQLSGVSTRTLRYYDEIGLLKPARTNEAGYRFYGQWEVDMLQQILFYRALDMKLATIQAIVQTPNFQHAEALKTHKAALLQRKEQLETILQTVEKTIQSIEEEQPMSNEEKFKGFKEKLMEDNEKQYGKEIREKYGNETVDASNAKLMNMTEQQYQAMQQLEQQMFERLAEAMKLGDAASDIAMEVAELHKRWLNFTWKEYSKEAHAGLAQMYIADERFTAYYDERGETGAAQFLHDAIIAYTSK